MASKFLVRGSRSIGLLAVVAALFATLFAASASADTLYPPGTGAFGLNVNTNSTNYPYVQNGLPPDAVGPTISGVSDGQTMTVSVNGTASSSTFARVRVRQCTGTANVNNIADFDPFTTNKCTSVPLGGGDAFKDSGALAPGTSTASVSFKVGIGTAPDTISGFDGSTLPGFTCDATHPCKLVAYTSVSSSGGSTNFQSYPINFAAPPETALMDCDHVAGTGSYKPALTSTGQIVSMSLKGTNFGPCTGSLAASSGPLTKVTGKLTGSSSCNANAVDPASPISGKVTLTYTTLDSKGKPVASSAYVRVAYGATGDRLDVANGLVIKGVGIGGDVSASLLNQPTVKKGVGNSVVDALGNIVPGAGSLTLQVNCAAGIDTVATTVWGTDGHTLTSVALNSSFKLSLPS